jgi:hypothetical protein
MDIPIKMIDLATMISWIFLIVFSVSVVYSVKDLAFDFGKPQIGTASDGRILFSLPIEIVNNGYYSIGLFNITTRVLDENGSTITEGSTLIPKIEKGERQAILHNMTFDLGRMSHLSQSYLFNDTQLGTIESVSMNLGEFIPVQVSGNFSIPWGAPLYNFKLGQLQYAPLNSTHIQATVSLSFDNHASVDIAGEAQLYMYTSANQLVGSDRIDVEAAQHSHYDRNAKFQIAISSITRTGCFEVKIHTGLFSYGPVVIPYG